MFFLDNVRMYWEKLFLVTNLIGVYESPTPRKIERFGDMCERV